VASKNPERFEKLFYTKELYRGVKDSWSAKTYPSVWMLRRLLFAGTVFILSDLHIYYKFAILVMIQILYIMYLLIERPFTSVLESMAEISNEGFILLLLAPLMYFNTEKQWSWMINLVYLLGLLVSNAVFTTIS
jgi:hypothetical protein